MKNRDPNRVSERQPDPRASRGASESSNRGRRTTPIGNRQDVNIDKKAAIRIFPERGL
jgi:hypothetical protein